jgi:D-erythro-7,8-dihydroneopterin triphosphate epimerase
LLMGVNPLTENIKYHPMQIQIKNLRLRTVLGIYRWERKELQDIIINVSIELDGSKASRSDSIKDTVNYKTIKKEIINAVETSSFRLLESLSTHILELIMRNTLVNRACIEIDKPHALRFADSVSVKSCAER